MSMIVSNNSYDFNNQILVPVIASFDSEGRIKPLYLRINEESLKIRSSWPKPAFSNTSTFQCQVEDNGVIKPLILTYYHQESVWTIPRFSAFSSQ